MLVGGIATFVASFRLCSGQKTLCAYPILYVGRGDVNRERETQGVHQEVALAPFDIFVSVIAAWVGRFFDGLDALGIHNGRRRLGILAYPLPLRRTQRFEDKEPQSAQSEPSEVIVNGRPRRKVMGQEPPMAAAF